MSALIVIMGVMNGLQNDLREKILIGSPDIRVLTYGEDMVMTDWQTVLRRCKRSRASSRRRRSCITQALVSARAQVHRRRVSSMGIAAGGAGVPQVTTIRDARDGRRLHVRDDATASIAAPCSVRSWPNG